MWECRGKGKLLLTGEYTVLDGVAALAVPTLLGQRMQVGALAEPTLRWTSIDRTGFTWLGLDLDPETWQITKLLIGDPAAADRLVQLLQAAVQMNPEAAALLPGKAVTTRLEFARDWGLGSSSTLVHCLSQWLAVDPYALLAATFGGSGYDLACAAATGPVLYQRQVGKQPLVKPLDWNPGWLQQTYFIHRNQKQNSREGIRRYRERKITPQDLAEIEQLTAALIDCETLAEAQQILHQHEAHTGRLIGLPPVQEELFPDFPGQIKSLGAWGGDFIWALTELEESACRAYFNTAGFPTVLSWSEMIGA